MAIPFALTYSGPPLEATGVYSMSKYGTKMTIQTNAGGEIKPATISIQVEANSSEEAVVRLRSACARIMHSTKPKNIGESILHLVDDKAVSGTDIIQLSFGKLTTGYTHHPAPSHTVSFSSLTEDLSYEVAPRNNDHTTSSTETGNQEPE